MPSNHVKGQPHDSSITFFFGKWASLFSTFQYTKSSILNVVQVHVQPYCSLKAIGILHQKHETVSSAAIISSSSGQSQFPIGQFCHPVHFTLGDSNLVWRRFVGLLTAFLQFKDPFRAGFWWSVQFSLKSLFSATLHCVQRFSAENRLSRNSFRIKFICMLVKKIC